MDNEAFNISIRKFLKKTGINSQREIETSIRSAITPGLIQENDLIDVSMTLKIDKLSVEVVTDGQIQLE